MKWVASIIFLLATAYSLHATPALAQIPSPISPDLVKEITRQGTEAAAKGYNLPIEALRESDIRFFLANLVKQLLLLIGVIFVVLTVYAGALWMTSNGEEEKIKKAKATIVRAAVGILIVLSSYSVAIYVERKLLDAVWKQPFFLGGQCDAKFEDYNQCVSEKRKCKKELKTWQDCVGGANTE